MSTSAMNTIDSVIDTIRTQISALDDATECPISLTSLRQLNTALYDYKQRLQQLETELGATLTELQQANVYREAAENQLAQRQQELAELHTKCDAFAALMNESSGVAGYHLNDDVAPWGEFPELVELAGASGGA